jgi:hypothetical protein
MKKRVVPQRKVPIDLEERAEVPEVQGPGAIGELVVADAGEERAVREQRRLGVEERLPLRRIAPVFDEVAGVEQEIGLLRDHGADHRRVRGVVAAVVAVDEEAELGAVTGLRRGGERALAHRASRTNRIGIAPPRLEARQAERVEPDRLLALELAGRAGVAELERRGHGRVDLHVHDRRRVADVLGVRPLGDRREHAARGGDRRGEGEGEGEEARPEEGGASGGAAHPHHVYHETTPWRFAPLARSQDVRHVRRSAERAPIPPSASGPPRHETRLLRETGPPPLKMRAAVGRFWVQFLGIGSIDRHGAPDYGSRS